MCRKLLLIIAFIAFPCIAQGYPDPEKLGQEIKRLEEYLQKAQDLEELPQDRIERLQDAIIVRIRALSGEAVISPRWAQLKLQLNDPGFEERLVSSTAEEPEPSE